MDTHKSAVLFPVEVSSLMNVLGVCYPFVNKFQEARFCVILFGEEKTLLETLSSPLIPSH